MKDLDIYTFQLSDHTDVKKPLDALRRAKGDLANMQANERGVEGKINQLGRGLADLSVKVRMGDISQEKADAITKEHADLKAELDSIRSGIKLIQADIDKLDKRRQEAQKRVKVHLSEVANREAERVYHVNARKFVEMASVLIKEYDQACDNVVRFGSKASPTHRSVFQSIKDTVKHIDSITEITDRQKQRVNV